MNVEFASIAAAWLITFAAHSCAIVGVGVVLARICRRCGSVCGEEVVWWVAAFAALGTATAHMLLRDPWWPALAHISYGADGLAGLPNERSALVTAYGELGWPAAVVLVALLVSALRSVRWSVTRFRLARFLRHRRPEAGPARKALDELVTTTGSQVVPRLTVHDELASPVAFGVLRPEIAVPVWALEFDADTQRSLLAHELAHLCRRDPLWRGLLDLLEVLFPWQVLIRPVRRRLETIAEFRCDSQAAEWTGAAATARSLVRAAGRMEQTAPREMVLAGMTTIGPLDQRVDRLLSIGPDPRKGSRWLALGLLVLVGVTTPALPGVSWEQTEPTRGLHTSYAASEGFGSGWTDPQLRRHGCRESPRTRCEALRSAQGPWEAHHDGGGRRSSSITTR